MSHKCQRESSPLGRACCEVNIPLGRGTGVGGWGEDPRILLTSLSYKSLSLEFLKIGTSDKVRQLPPRSAAWGCGP